MIRKNSPTAIHSSAAIAAFLLVAPAQCAESYLGTVISVIDGDTFRIKTETENVKIRLCGVDSPERRQPGYLAATEALASTIRGKQVHCIQVGGGTPCDGRSRPTSRDRSVAQCFIGEQDIATEMIRLRQACDWPHFSRGYYRLDAETCINPKKPRPKKRRR
jgi:endonuclease YncB( thermonuclease family)